MQSAISRMYDNIIVKSMYVIIFKAMLWAVKKLSPTKIRQQNVSKR